MELATAEIPRAEARQSYLDYRREAGRTNDPEARAELMEMAAAFRIAAREELALIALTPTITRGGTTVRTHVERMWSQQQQKMLERRSHYLVPNLAVAPADARFVFTLGVQQDGSVEFCDRQRPTDRYESGRFTLPTRFALPDGFSAGQALREWDRGAWAAQVPIVPPKHRPPGGPRGAANMRRYAVLWEADDWTWMQDPAPARDPALLRHVAGDIYAVLATWDLTELERIVLSGRSLPDR